MKPKRKEPPQIDIDGKSNEYVKSKYRNKIKEIYDSTKPLLGDLDKIAIIRGKAHKMGFQ